MEDKGYFPRSTLYPISTYCPYTYLKVTRSNNTPTSSSQWWKVPRFLLFSLSSTTSPLSRIYLQGRYLYLRNLPTIASVFSRVHRACRCRNRDNSRTGGFRCTRKTYVTSWTPPSSFPRSRSTEYARSSAHSHTHARTHAPFHRPNFTQSHWGSLGRIVASMHRIGLLRTWPGDNPILGSIGGIGTWLPLPLPPHGLENTLTIGVHPSFSTAHHTDFSSFHISLPCVIVAAKSRRGDLCHPLFFSRQRRRRDWKIVVLIEFLGNIWGIGFRYWTERERLFWNFG